jgi:SNF2 family DNA or RNA helicase
VLILDASGQRKGEKADAKIVNPLRLLAGDFDSEDFLTTESEDNTEPASKPVLSGSETEEEEAVIVNEDSDDESDLGENDDFKARYPTVFNLPVPSAASNPTSQNSQGESQSLSQRQEQAVIPIVPVQRNGTPSSLVYKPLEATPYTQEQLARFSFPLTADPNGPSVPQPLNRLLREYQRLGVQFLFDMYKNGRGGTLGDDMGLGKTIQGEFHRKQSR